MHGLGQTTTATVTVPTANSWEMWLIAIAVGFVVGYVLTPQRYEDEHGRKISKKEYYAAGGE